MNRLDTIARLSSEREYEDRLVKELNSYFIASLESIPELAEEERKELRKKLFGIVTDSELHSHLFNMLIQEVLDNGHDSY